MKRTEAIEWLEVMKENAIFEQYEALKMAIEALSIESSRKWETCFSCPLAKGCPQIQGKSNAEIAKYASEIPNGCPLSMSHDNDLISRAEAMNKCKNAENELTDEAERKGLRVARFIIGELPSIEAVQGEWIKKRVDGRGIHHGFCSKCGFNVKRNYNYNYCPNCGKKMKIVERR